MSQSSIVTETSCIKCGYPDCKYYSEDAPVLNCPHPIEGIPCQGLVRFDLKQSTVVKCGATFKQHCQYPKCDCDRIDPLVARDCVVMDGHCDCKRNPDGGIPDGCKYLTRPKK